MANARHPAFWLRHGDTSDAANVYRMLTAAPSGASVGIPVPPDHRDEHGVINLISYAAGAHAATIVLWGYVPAQQIYISDVLTAVGAHAQGGPGWQNFGEITISESTAGPHRNAHQLRGLTVWTRLYAQATSVSGAPSLWADFGFSRPVQK